MRSRFAGSFRVRLSEPGRDEVSEDREEPSGSIDPSDERRRFQRFLVRLRVLFQRSGAAHFIEAETYNISLGGVFIKTRHRGLEPGTPVAINIQHDAAELMVSGIIRWASDDVSAHQERGMGVQFRDLDESQRRELQAIIDAVHARLRP